MSMAIMGSEYPVNDNRLHGLALADQDQATELTSWEAIKDFFVRLLNLLPGVNVESRKACFDKIFREFWPNSDSRSGGGVDCALGFVEKIPDVVGVDNAKNFRFSLAKDVNGGVAFSISYRDDNAKPKQSCSVELKFPATEVIVGRPIVEGDGEYDVYVRIATVINQVMTYDETGQTSEYKYKERILREHVEETEEQPSSTAQPSQTIKGKTVADIHQQTIKPNENVNKVSDTNTGNNCNKTSEGCKPVNDINVHEEIFNSTLDGLKEILKVELTTINVNGVKKKINLCSNAINSITPNDGVRKDGFISVLYLKTFSDAIAALKKRIEETPKNERHSDILNGDYDALGKCLESPEFKSNGVFNDLSNKLIALRNIEGFVGKRSLENNSKSSESDNPYTTMSTDV